MRFRNTKGYAGALAILGAFAVFLFTDKYHRRLPVKIFYGRYSYEALGLEPLEGILIRIVCYGISFVLIYLFMLVFAFGEEVLFLSGGEHHGGLYFSMVLSTAV